MLEETPDFYLDRLGAILLGTSGFTDDEYMKDKGKLLDKLQEEHGDFIDGFARKITPRPEKVNTEVILAWLRRESDRGARILIIDPVTMRDPGSEIHASDHELVNGMIGIMQEYQNNIVVTHHPNKSRTAITSGGASWENFCQTVLYLESIQDDGLKDVIVGQHQAMGYPLRENLEVNRLLQVSKARHARKYDGITFAMNWNIGKMRHELQGIWPRREG